MIDFEQQGIYFIYEQNNYYEKNIFNWYTKHNFKKP